MGVERFKIPKTLDNPMRAIGMPIDSVIVGVVTWLLFFLFEASLFGIVGAPLAGYMYQRYKKKSIIRSVARVLYWYLPTGLNPIKEGAKGYGRKMKIRRKSEKSE